MDIQSAILGSSAIDSIAGQLGIAPDQARAGAAALLPSILGGFKRDAQQREDGLGGMIDGLSRLGGGMLAETVATPDATDPTPGNDILGTIFGSKDVSRAVAAEAGNQAGVDPSVLRRMLPLLAMLVAGYLATRGRGEPTPAEASQAPAEAATGGLGGIFGGLIGSLGGVGAAAQHGGGLGGLASALDLDGDGNPLDDILGRIGGLTGR